jgi:hypothetical protein
MRSARTSRSCCWKIGAFVLCVALASPAVAQRLEDARKPKFMAQMFKVERALRWTKLQNGMKLPPTRSLDLDYELREIYREFPEYSDDVDRYVLSILPWYPLPVR